MMASAPPEIRRECVFVLANPWCADSRLMPEVTTLLCGRGVVQVSGTAAQLSSTGAWHGALSKMDCGLGGCCHLLQGACYHHPKLVWLVWCC